MYYWIQIIIQLCICNKNRNFGHFRGNFRPPPPLLDPPVKKILTLRRRLCSSSYPTHWSPLTTYGTSISEIQCRVPPLLSISQTLKKTLDDYWSEIDMFCLQEFDITALRSLICSEISMSYAGDKKPILITKYIVLLYIYYTRHLVIGKKPWFHCVGPLLAPRASVWGKQPIVAGTGEGEGSTIQCHADIYFGCRCPLLKPVVYSPFLKTNCYRTLWPYQK